MKKFTLLTFSLFVTFIIMGQDYHPFPSANTIWNNHLYVSNGPHMQIESIARLGIYGDTVINEKLYNKLYLIVNDSILDFSKMTYHAAIRENNKQIFVKLIENDNETLIYDFGLNIGDTIISNATTGYLATNTNIIIDIDSVEVNDNTFRKRFKTNSQDYWIEGIGSIGGLLLPITDINYIYLNNWPILACLKENNVVVYLYEQTDVCFLQQATAIENHENKRKSINIYPNPTSHNITIESEKQIGISTINIYNSRGAQIINDTFNSFPYKCNLNEFPSGMYFIHMIIEDITYTEIIIKY